MGKMRFPMATTWEIGIKSLISPEWAKSDLPTLGTTDSSAPILSKMPTPSRGCGDPLLPVFPNRLSFIRREAGVPGAGILPSQDGVQPTPKMVFYIGGQPVKGGRTNEIAARVPENAMNPIEVAK